MLCFSPEYSSDDVIYTYIDLAQDLDKVHRQILLNKLVFVDFLDSERSEECIDFTMICFFFFICFFVHDK